MKLDQAQYRELEAFSKFGSDLDSATKFVLEKGKRNVEILKQPQYTPMKVEHQVAIIACGTKGWLQDIPVDKVRNFEDEYIFHLENREKALLNDLKAGKMDDEILSKLENVAKDISRKYKA